MSTETPDSSGLMTRAGDISIREKSENEITFRLTYMQMHNKMEIEGVHTAWCKYDRQKTARQPQKKAVQNIM